MKNLMKKIENLGNSHLYKEQAETFLKATGAKIEARYVKTAPHFPGETERESRDIYEVRISRGGRSYTTMYGDSIANTEERIAATLNTSEKMLAPRIRRGETTGGLGMYSFAHVVKERKWKDEHSKMLDVSGSNAGQRPDAYSVLTSITTSEPPDDVDSFASEYGYTKPSEATRVYEAVKEEYAAMLTLFNDEEMQALSGIV